VDWILSRQVAGELSDDYLRYSTALQQDPPPPKYSTLEKSLNTLLSREGPVLGLGGCCYKGSLAVAELADDRSIRCYGGWNLFSKGNSEYVKCIRVGSR
jgi:hypothetical protein